MSAAFPGPAHHSEAARGPSNSNSKISQPKRSNPQPLNLKSDPRRVFPVGLDDATLERAIKELPVGARLASETVYKCWKEGKFGDEEFLSFMKSISSYSPTLSKYLSTSGHNATAAAPQGKSRGGAAAKGAPLEAGSMEVNAEQNEAMGYNKEWLARRRVEAKRRRFDGFEGNENDKKRLYVVRTLQKLREQLPAEGQPNLLDAVRNYVNGKATPDAFCKVLQDLTDKHQITIPLDYTPQRSYRSTSADQPPSKRQASNSQEAERNKASAKPKKTKPAIPAKAIDIPLDKPVENLSTAGAKYTVEDLQFTPLADYLTEKARKVLEDPNGLFVKVISDAEVYKQLPEPLTKNNFRSHSWCSYRCKAIMAFRRLPSGKDVSFFCMYVHEYGRGCPPPNSGRVFIECIDSTPLYPEEKGSERQGMLTSIIHAYMEYVAAQGFRFAHMRVPPPTDENSHIFASRSVNVRLRAATHLANWFKRLLEVAQNREVIDGYSAASHVSMHNFPPSLLEPGHLAADMAFRYACGNGDAASANDLGYMPGVGNLDKQVSRAMFLEAAGQLKDRFFVITLKPPSNANDPRLRIVNTPTVPSNVSGARSDLVKFYAEEGASFHDVTHNSFATMKLVQRVVEDQKLGARGGPGGQEGREPRPLFSEANAHPIPFANGHTPEVKMMHNGLDKKLASNAAQDGPHVVRGVEVVGSRQRPGMVNSKVKPPALFDNSTLIKREPITNGRNAAAAQHPPHAVPSDTFRTASADLMQHQLPRAESSTLPDTPEHSDASTTNDMLDGLQTDADACGQHWESAEANEGAIAMGEMLMDADDLLGGPLGAAPSLASLSNSSRFPNPNSWDLDDPFNGGGGGDEGDSSWATLCSL